MIAYAASQAVSPAVERMKRFLFQPFRFWTFLKLAFVAVLTEGGSSSYNGSQSRGSHPTPGPLFGSGFEMTPASVLVAILIAALALMLVFWLWYLIVRLRFAFFHCLVHQVREIAPGWRLYARPAMRMFQLHVVFALLFLAGLALLAAPFVYLFRGPIFSGRQPDLGSIVLAVAVAIPLFLALIVVAIASRIIMDDFLTPHMALEGATVAEAWQAARPRYLAEKGGFWLYGLLRVLLAFVAELAAILILVIPGLVALIVYAGIFAGLHAALPDASGSGYVLRMTIDAVLAAVGVALGIVALLFLTGPIATWKREYAVVFYGGRYETLGNLLSPPPPPVDASAGI